MLVHLLSCTVAEPSFSDSEDFAIMHVVLAVRMWGGEVDADSDWSGAWVDNLRPLINTKKKSSLGLAAFGASCSRLHNNRLFPIIQNVRIDERGPIDILIGHVGGVRAPFACAKGAMRWRAPLFWRG